MSRPDPSEIRVKITAQDGQVLSLTIGQPAEMSGCDRDAAAENWMDLRFQQCPGCPRGEKDSYLCPAAVSLKPVVESFCARLHSYDPVLYQIDEDGVSQPKTGPAQAALCELLFFLLSRCGCPNLILDFRVHSYLCPGVDAERRALRQRGSGLYEGRRNSATDSGRVGADLFCEVCTHMIKRLRGAEGIATDAIDNALIRLHSLMRMAYEFPGMLASTVARRHPWR
jgi:hypothetical protein